MKALANFEVFSLAKMNEKGDLLAGINTAFDTIASNNLKVSILFDSNSFVVPTGVLQPTPLCQIA